LRDRTHASRQISHNCFCLAPVARPPRLQSRT
jgi:hypothetical protein